MKRAHWHFLLIGVFLAVLLGVIFVTKDSMDPPHPSDLSSPAKTTHRAPRGETAFWESAITPDPGEQIPIPTIRPEDLGIAAPTTPFDPVVSITKAVVENNQPAIQSAVLAWFEQEPVAAREWLASQPTLDDLQPAICYIANRISENGDVPNAIQWANILTDPTAKANTLFDIQALALRNRQITTAEIETEGLSEEHIRELLSGAAGD